MIIQGTTIYGGTIYDTGGLYDFSTFTFTTGSTVGPTGANVQWLFANSYSSSNASNVWLTNTTYYGVSKPGYQYWIVPQTAQYTIEVAGSRSGIPTYSNTNAAARYGRGAVVRATFTLQQGTNVTIAVGQPSANTTQPSTFSTPGGGGGTFVVLPGNFPLIVAGGGGSAGNWTSNATILFGGNGQTTTFGGNSFNGAPGGFNGWGGNSHVNLNGVASANGYDSGGGGGFVLPGVYGGSTAAGNTRPGPTTTNNFGQGGWHFLANLVGGLYSTSYLPPSTSSGGFGGGGGAGPITGGGGGGYSGGGGAYSNNSTAIDAGGGGGSWIAANATAVATSDGQYNRSGTFGGASITNLATVNAGPGYVRITKL
jgi:hypothetical protein